MKKPDKIPQPVLDSIDRFCKEHNLNKVNFLSPDNLKWDTIMGCYHFDCHGMYYGIELDGYIHT